MKDGRNKSQTDTKANPNLNQVESVSERFDLYMKKSNESNNNPVKTPSFSELYPKNTKSKLMFYFLDSVPLLIIDVNIRPGEKKKIVVYEGDTADKLADNFAKENSNIFSLLRFG